MLFASYIKYLRTRRHRPRYIGTFRLVNSANFLYQERKLPIRILYPTDWFPASNDKHQAILEAFTCSLEQYLGITRTEISLSELWSKTAPEESRESELSDYIAGVSQLMYKNS